MHNDAHAHGHQSEDGHGHSHGGWERPLYTRDRAMRQGAEHNRAMRVGIGGPVGSGKTALVEKLCKSMSGTLSLAAITNDIYTREDADILLRAQALPIERIIGVETGGCPHTAIREDASMNVEAIEELESRIPDLDMVFIESGGDNLAAAFSPELVDRFIYIIDVAQGEKIPRKGGPGIMRSDLLVINKIDLAPHVGASLQVMRDDTRRMRDSDEDGERPFLFTNMMSGEGVAQIVAWLQAEYAASDLGVAICNDTTASVHA